MEPPPPIFPLQPPARPANERTPLEIRRDGGDDVVYNWCMYISIYIVELMIGTSYMVIGSIWGDTVCQAVIHPVDVGLSLMIMGGICLICGFVHMAIAMHYICYKKIISATFIGTFAYVVNSVAFIMYAVVIGTSNIKACIHIFMYGFAYISVFTVISFIILLLIVFIVTFIRATPPT